MSVGETGGDAVVLAGADQAANVGGLSGQESGGGHVATPFWREDGGTAASLAETMVMLELRRRQVMIDNGMRQRQFCEDDGATIAT